jgi:archaellin
MKKFFAIAGLLLCTNLVFGQSVQDVSFKTRPDASPGVNLSSFIIQLTDSTQIEKIEVTIGTADGLSDVLNQSFVFDQSSGLSTGLAYARNANAVFLETGAITELPTYFGRVRLKLTNGQFTDYFSFTSN